MSQKKEVTNMSAKERYRYIRQLYVGKDTTNAEVARLAKVSRQRLYKVMLGIDRGYRIRRIIAEVVDVPVETLFPDTPPSQRKAA